MLVAEPRVGRLRETAYHSCSDPRRLYGDVIGFLHPCTGMLSKSSSMSGRGFPGLGKRALGPAMDL